MIVDKNCTEMNIPGTMMKNGKPLTLALVGEDGKSIFDFLTKEAKAKSSALIFDITEARLRNEWRKACGALGHGVFKKKCSYRGLSVHDFRRSAARNFTANGVDETTAMSITGHATSSMFKRYNIVNTANQNRALGKVLIKREDAA